LVEVLIPFARPAHVFYYQLLDGDRAQPQTECEEEGPPDTAVFVPSDDPTTPDVPRPAAAWVLAGKSRMRSLTGAPSADYYFHYGLPGADGDMAIPE
jgi:hypothetical protein